MNRIYLLLLLAAPLLANSQVQAASRVERGNLTFDNIPEAPADLAEKLDGYLNARQATPLGWSPQGQLLIATRFGDVDQLHLVDQAGGARRQLTFLHEPIAEAAFSPDPGRNAYVYLKDVGGNENTQLYYQRVGEPAAKLLTDGKYMNGAPRWSDSGREVAFFSTARDGRSYDIDIVDPETGTLPHLALAGDSSSGQKREVDPAAAKVGIAGAKFTRDGQGVYFISDRDGEFARLRYMNLYTNEKTVISGHIPWDIEELAISRDV